MEIKRERQERSSAIKFSVEEDGSVVGWAYLYIIFNDRHDEPYGLMENVYIEKEQRGKGLGKTLVEAVIAEARSQGCYKIIAQSRYGKKKVHELYEKFGFSDHGKNFRMNLKDSDIKQQD